MKVLRNKTFSLIQHNVAAHRYIELDEVTRISEMLNISAEKEEMV